MPASLGEFEQLLLLAILRCGEDASAPSVAETLEADAGRAVSRGALYTTLDRLEHKGLVRWKLAAGGQERARLPRRLYAVTPRGIAAVRAAQDTLARMSDGLEHILRRSSRGQS
jgi:DNA-binding PadR family transcriptional regulator